MKDFTKFNSRVILNFETLPEYEKNNHLGETLSANLSVVLNFNQNYRSLEILDGSKRDRQINLEEEFLISLIDISQTLDYLSQLIELIYNLKYGSSTKNLTPFISIDSDPDDLGIWWTFTRDKKQPGEDLFIQIDFRTKETICIKTTYDSFYSTLMDFANLALELINNMKIPIDYQESTIIRLYNLIAAIPLS